MICVMPLAASSQSHEVIGLIQMSISLLNHSYLLIYQVINVLDQIVIVCRNTTCHFSTSTIGFIETRCHHEFMVSDVVVFSVT